MEGGIHPAAAAWQAASTPMVPNSRTSRRNPATLQDPPQLCRPAQAQMGRADPKLQAAAAGRLHPREAAPPQPPPGRARRRGTAAPRCRLQIGSRAAAGGVNASTRRGRGPRRHRPTQGLARAETKAAAGEGREQEGGAGGRRRGAAARAA
jgi:hypothetical protein